MLSKHQLQYLSAHEPEICARFVDAPIIVAEKCVHDAINKRKSLTFRKAVHQEVHQYHSVDTFRKSGLPDLVQRALWNLSTSKTEDSLGLLPLCLGLPVMVTENLAQQNKVVNGSEGSVERIIFNVDDNGRRFAACVYVRISGSNINAVP